MKYINEMVKTMKEPAYSVTPEVDYVLSSKSHLPMKYLLQGDLLERLDYFRQAFADFCKAFNVNVDCSSAYYKFVQHIKKYYSNQLKWAFANTVKMMAQAMHDFQADMMRPQPVVHFVVAKPIERFQVKVSIRPTQVSVHARVVQRSIKDAFVKVAVSKGVKIIDVGGGLDEMQESAKKMGLKNIPTIESVDIKKDLDMNHFDYGAPEGKLITFLHSTYYMHPNLFLNLIKKYNVMGLVLVLDGDTEKISTDGEDYNFVATQVERGVYKVTGDIFGNKTVDSKGRRFKDEIWYTRRQLVQWGLKLVTFPSSTSELVRRHFVWFYKDSESCKRMDHLEPITVCLKEGNLTNVSSKVPSIYRLFHERPFLDKYCLFGMEHYQTDKADGINMKMMVDKNDLSLIMVDRFGMSFAVYNENGDKFYFPYYSSFILSVDLLMQPTEMQYQLPNYLSGALPDSKFKIYFNQVIQNDHEHGAPLFSLELENYLNFINGVFRQDLLGRKKYTLVHNFIYKFTPSVVNDGVVYVPVYSSCHLHADIFGCAHMFIKPFSSTDTNPYVMNEEINRLKPNRFKVWYREHGKVLTDLNPMAPNVVKALASTLYNTNSHHADVMLNPLLYEVLHFPKGVLDPKEDVLLITHVRGDKRKFSERLEMTNDKVLANVMGLTKFGENVEDMVKNFLEGLSDSRSIRMLPKYTGIAAGFIEKFMRDWKNGTDPPFYAKLDKHVDLERVYSGNVNELLMQVRQVLPYNTALLFMELLFRFPYVQKSYNYLGGQISLEIKVDLTKDYVFADML